MSETQVMVTIAPAIPLLNEVIQRGAMRMGIAERWIDGSPTDPADPAVTVADALSAIRI